MTLGIHEAEIELSTIIALIGCLAIGMVIYFTYGVKHSKVQQGPAGK